uniref:Uncharacterized protein n=1 Tax=Arundo donax TaxID=35708 RepID=A0A0A8ZRT1_ARUDO
MRKHILDSIGKIKLSSPTPCLVYAISCSLTKHKSNCLCQSLIKYKTLRSDLAYCCKQT